MPDFMLGVVVLILALWAVNAFSKADPKLAARAAARPGRRRRAAVRRISAISRRDRGRCSGWRPRASACSAGCRCGRRPSARRTQKSTGQISRVRTAFLEMELDHDSGAMRGRILAGRHDGAALDALDRAALIGLLAEIDERQPRSTCSLS